MPTQRKNVVVTGGAGFIGCLLCERLLKKANVICIDNFITSDQKNIDHLLKLPNFKFINHDFTEPLDLEADKDLMQFQLKVFGIKEVYNFACPTSVKNFEKLRLQTVMANTRGLINALEMAVKYKAKFMQFSSSVVYGEVPRGEFVAEDYRGISDMLDERACYDEGKRYAESVVDNYRRVHNLDTKIVRVFRTYGPRMLLNDGQMIPDFILNALENKDLVIHGDEDFQTSLCFVNDIVDGCIQLMSSKLNDPVNMGSPEVYKLVDVAHKIIELTNSNSKVIFDKPKSFMRELALPDITKIKNEIGWFPIVTIEEGLKKTVDFTRAHKDLLAFSTEI